MKTLHFNVHEQQLTATDIPDNLIKGTRLYLRCAFHFEDKEWIGCLVVAEFNGYYLETVTAYECNVPDEVAAKQYFKVRLVGVNGDYRITTNEVIIKQKGMQCKFEGKVYEWIHENPGNWSPKNYPAAWKLVE